MKLNLKSYYKHFKPNTKRSLSANIRQIVGFTVLFILLSLQWLEPIFASSKMENLANITNLNSSISTSTGLCANSFHASLSNDFQSLQTVSNKNMQSQIASKLKHWQVLAHASPEQGQNITTSLADIAVAQQKKALKVLQDHLDIAIKNPQSAYAQNTLLNTYFQIMAIPHNIISRNLLSSARGFFDILYSKASLADLHSKLEAIKQSYPDIMEEIFQKKFSKLEVLKQDYTYSEFSFDSHNIPLPAQRLLIDSNDHRWVFPIVKELSLYERLHSVLHFRFPAYLSIEFLNHFDFTKNTSPTRMYNHDKAHIGDIIRNWRKDYSSPMGLELGNESEMIFPAEFIHDRNIILSFLSDVKQYHDIKIRNQIFWALHYLIWDNAHSLKEIAQNINNNQLHMLLQKRNVYSNILAQIELTSIQKTIGEFYQKTWYPNKDSDLHDEFHFMTKAVEQITKNRAHLVAPSASK